MKSGTASTKMSTGQFREFAGAVLRSLPDDLDESVVQGWIQNQESLRKALREALAPNGKSADNAYPLVVDYGLSVETAVRAGRYDWSNDNITSRNFPTKRKEKRQVVVELVHLDRSASTEDVLRELDKADMRPAELHELLALGEVYPELQRGFPVVALGSVWQYQNGYRDVPYLYRRGAERLLDLSWIEFDWREICRFAAVRK
jgi:hypothetical protein